MFWFDITVYQTLSNPSLLKSSHQISNPVMRVDLPFVWIIWYCVLYLISVWTKSRNQSTNRTMAISCQMEENPDITLGQCHIMSNPIDSCRNDNSIVIWERRSVVVVMWQLRLISSCAGMSAGKYFPIRLYDGLSLKGVPGGLMFYTNGDGTDNTLLIKSDGWHEITLAQAVVII